MAGAHRQDSGGGGLNPRGASEDDARPAGGSAGGGVRWLLRAEGMVVLIAAVLAYARYGNGWGVFALCFLLPDLSFLGYAAGRRPGALLYNAAHSYVGAVACLSLAIASSSPWALSLALIWLAHIGFDRALGYGLKYESGFEYTHLGSIGRARDGGAGKRGGTS